MSWRGYQTVDQPPHRPVSASLRADAAAGQQQPSDRWDGARGDGMAFLSPMRSTLSERRSLDEVSSLSSYSHLGESPAPPRSPSPSPSPSATPIREPSHRGTHRSLLPPAPPAPPPPHEPADAPYSGPQPKEVVEGPPEPGPGFVPSEFEAEQPWKPAYLHRRVLLASIALCAALVVAVEVLVGYSAGHQGLAASHTGLHYLWTYGPTLILTAIGAVWTRVDYQAKTTAPWYRLAGGRPASAELTLLLDYVGPMPPRTLLRALRHRDFQVAASTGITLLWSLLIAFSASLISLATTEIGEVAVPVTLLTSLRDSSAALQGVGSLPYYNMLGLQEKNLTFPDGVTERYAYQSFAGPTIGANTELHTTVDAFSAGLECQEADFHISRAIWLDTGMPMLNYTMSSADCPVTSSFFGPKYTLNETYFSRFGPVSCRNSSDTNDRRIAVMFGSLVYGEVPEIPTPGFRMSANMSRSVQLLCRPLYTISSVDASKNGTTVLNVTESSSPNVRTLANVSSWNIMDAHIQSVSNALTDPYVNSAGQLQGAWNVNASDVVVDTDQYMHLALGQFANAPPSSATLLNTTFLQNATLIYYQKYTAFLVHHMLMEPTSLDSTGLAFLYQDRLVVNSTAGHVMTAILIVVAALFVVVILATPRADSLLPCAPSDILGIAILVRHSSTVIERLRNIGRADSNTIGARLAGTSYLTTIHGGSASQPKYLEIMATDDPKMDQPRTEKQLSNAAAAQPPSIHPWSRAGMIIVAGGMIAALEGLLQFSQHNNGVADVPRGDLYIHYTWTTVPALILTITGLVYSSMDSHIRTLTPYANLSKGESFSRTIGLDLMDLSVPRMLLRGIRTGSFAAVACTLTALVASLLVTFSSSLFMSVTVPTTTSVQLRAVESLSNSTKTWPSGPTTLGLTGALILQSNLSYPAFTYEDLVFPKLSLELDSRNNHSLTVDAVVSAVRSKMDCQLHDMSDLATQVDKVRGINVISVNLTDTTCPYPTLLNRYSLAGTIPEDFIMAKAIASMGCSDWSYVWTTLTSGTNTTVSTMSALTCNETYEAVDVAASFRNAELRIDPDATPPAPLPDTARNTSAGTSMYKQIELYDYLPNVTEGTLQLDPFFASLTTSRYAIPAAALRSAATAPRVRAAILHQHGVIRAQELNDFNRVPAGNTTAFVRRGGGGGSDADVAYAANATDATGRVRVVQDAAATRALEALLAAVLALSLAAWALMPRTRVLAADPTSLAAVMALLADGNVYDVLPPLGASRRDAECVLAPLTFRMGWGNVVAPDESEAKEPRFGIFGTL